MPRLKRQSWSVGAAAIAASLAMHVVPWLLAPAAETVAGRNVPVKIRLVEREPVERVAPPVARATQAAGAEQVQRKRAAAAVEKTGAAAAPQAGPEPSPAPASPEPLRYEQLFPGAEAAFAGGSGAEAGRGSAGEASGPGFAVSSRSVAKLTYLARDLAERVDVPRSLRLLSPFGIARATLRRVDRDNHWKATSFAGDPYFRAVLYEALSRMLELGERSVGIASLAKSELEVLRITFEFRTTSIVDVRAKPIDVIVDGDRVTLILTHKSEDSVAAAVMPIGDGKALLNLIGTVKVMQQHLTTQSEKDLDLRRLRASPAFLKALR